MRLLLDEMWPPFAAEALRRRGHDVAAVAHREELRAKTDDTIWAAALREGRVIVTADVGDFRSMVAAAALAGHPYPPLILTDSRVWLMGRSRTAASGRLVRALDVLLSSGVTIEAEHWLRPVD